MYPSNIIKTPMFKSKDLLLISGVTRGRPGGGAVPPPPKVCLIVLLIFALIGHICHTKIPSKTLSKFISKHIQKP